MVPESTGARPLATSIAGLRIVVTRSVADNRSLTARLTELGAEVVELPLVEVTDPADGGRALRAAVDRLDRYRYVILTSTNGVRALADSLGSRPWPSGVIAVPVGPVTERLATELGMTVGNGPTSATVETLVAEFPPWASDGRCAVLAPLAALAGDVVVHGLSAKGYVVDRCEAYRTQLPELSTEPDRLGLIRDGVDAVLFFSPSAVDRFVDLLNDAALPAAELVGLTVCIGPSTAARAAERSFSSIVVAEPHTEAGVISALTADSRGFPGAGTGTGW